MRHRHAPLMQATIPSIIAAEHPNLLYDYYGFEDEAYKLKLPAPGTPVLAKEVQELLRHTLTSPPKCRLLLRQALCTVLLHGRTLQFVPMALRQARPLVCCRASSQGRNSSQT